MRFEWDENKNRQNLRKHGFDFADERGSEIIRIISLRKATRRENKRYKKAVQDQLETG